MKSRIIKGLTKPLPVEISDPILDRSILEPCLFCRSCKVTTNHLIYWCVRHGIAVERSGHCSNFVKA